MRSFIEQDTGLTPKAAAQQNAGGKSRLWAETGRNPLPIARSVVAEQGLNLGLSFPAGLAERLVEHAEVMSAKEPRFREGWAGETPQRGRRALRTFFWWWLPHTLSQLDPALAQQIPKDYWGNW